VQDLDWPLNRWSSVIEGGCAYAWFRRWNPTEEPFSYAKLCFYYIPFLLVFLGIAALLISAFGGLAMAGSGRQLVPIISTGEGRYRCCFDRGVLRVLHEGSLEAPTGQHSDAHSVRRQRSQRIEGRHQIILGPAQAGTAASPKLSFKPG
jgi:hypothetical protein